MTKDPQEQEVTARKTFSISLVTKGQRFSHDEEVVQWKGFRDSSDPENCCQWNPESWFLKSGIQLKESGTPLTIGNRNPSSTDKESWIPLTTGNRNPSSTYKELGIKYLKYSLRKQPFSPRFSRLGTLRAEEHLRLSDRNSILMV